MLLHRRFRKSKRGIEAFVIAIIIAVVAGVVILYLWGTFKVMADAASQDEARRFGSEANILHLKCTDLEAAEDCMIVPVDIRPAGWDDNLCDKEKYGPDIIKGKLGDPNRCAAQQILEVLRRSWYVGGEGHTDFGICHNFDINVLPCGEYCKNNGLNVSINRDLLRKVAEETNYTKNKPYSSILPSTINFGETVRFRANVQYDLSKKEIHDGELWGVIMLDGCGALKQDDYLILNYEGKIQGEKSLKPRKFERVA